jgi:hypothetical protein
VTKLTAQIYVGVCFLSFKMLLKIPLLIPRRSWGVRGNKYEKYIYLHISYKQWASSTLPSLYSALSTPIYLFKKFPARVCPKVRHRIHNSIGLFSVPRHFMPFHTLATCSSNVHFNSVVPTTLRCVKCSLHVTILKQIYWILKSSYVLHDLLDLQGIVRGLLKLWL